MSTTTTRTPAPALVSGTRYQFPETRNEAGRFVPGQSGNPGGRAKPLAALVRERTGDGAELVELFLDVLRGKKRANLKQRLEAANWLAERGWGKVPQPLEHGGTDGGPVQHEYRIVFDE